MTYPNILRNPMLKTNDEVLQVEEIAVPGYPPQYIWNPTDWKTTVTPTMKGLYAKRMTDLQIIPTVWPQSVNGQRVLTIEANTKHFVVKLEQSAIALKANQRYLIKVLFTPAVQIVGEANPADLAWRIMINRDEIVLTDGFQNADAISEWGQPRSILMVIHSHAVQTVDLAVEFWSKFGNLDKQIYIHSVEMLEVEVDYGDGGNMHFLGTPQTEIPIPTPDPPTDPLPDDTTLPTAPGWLVALMLLVCACVIGAFIYSIVQPRLAVQVAGVNIMEDAFAQLVSWIIQTANVDGLPFAIALGTLLTGLTKMALSRVPKKYRPSGQLTALAWQVVIWAFWMAAKQYQFEEQFMVMGANFTPIVIMLVNSILGTKFQSVIYDKFLATKVSIAGYQRTP